MSITFLIGSSYPGVSNIIKDKELLCVKTIDMDLEFLELGLTKQQNVFYLNECSMRCYNFIFYYLSWDQVL